jgi:hypothetical protein
MSGRSRRWICCSAAVALVLLSGWRIAETAGLAPASHPTRSVGAVNDATSLQDRRVVAEPAAAKRVEIERLVAVMVAATAVVLAAVAGGLAGGRPAIPEGRDRWRLRSRGPPLAFVS